MQTAGAFSFAGQQKLLSLKGEKTMPTRLKQLNAAAKKAQEKRDAIAQEQKALA